jgi:hypothetical protein
LALTLPAISDRSVGIVRSWTKATELLFSLRIIWGKIEGEKYLKIFLHKFPIGFTQHIKNTLQKKELVA